MTLSRRLTNLEADMDKHTEPVPAVILSDGRVLHRGCEITEKELEELPTNDRGIRAVNFQASDPPAAELDASAAAGA